MFKYLNKLKKFLLEDLWEIEIGRIFTFKAFLYRQIRVAYIVWRGFVEDKCPLHASALVYTTLLSIVPFLAVIFSISKGFGIKALESLIIDKTFVGMSDVIGKIVYYAKNTDTRALGIMGGGVLVFTAVQLLSTIEKSFNSIWGVKRSRSIFRKVSDYISVLVVGPVLVAGAVGLTASLETVLLTKKIAYASNISQIIIHIIPFVFLWVAFTSVYVFIPNTRVKIQHALIGGVIAGTLWQMAQWGYINFGIGVAKYNAIYGGFAQFPLFLIWLYISWVIILLGAEISFASQNVKTYTIEKQAQSVSYAFKEELALYLVILIAKNFYFEKQPLTAEQISQKLNVSIRLIREILFQMCKSGVLNEINSEVIYYQPARDLEKISIEGILNSLKNYEEKPSKKLKIEDKSVEEIINKINQAKGVNITLRDIVLQTGFGDEE